MAPMLELVESADSFRFAFLHILAVQLKKEIEVVFHS